MFLLRLLQLQWCVFCVFGYYNINRPIFYFTICLLYTDGQGSVVYIQDKSLGEVNEAKLNTLAKRDHFVRYTYQINFPREACYLKRRHAAVLFCIAFPQGVLFTSGIRCTLVLFFYVLPLWSMPMFMGWTYVEALPNDVQTVRQHPHHYATVAPTPNVCILVSTMSWTYVGPASQTVVQCWHTVSCMLALGYQFNGCTYTSLLQYICGAMATNLKIKSLSDGISIVTER